MPVSDCSIASSVYVPPAFPAILKQYAKAAIRTQPYDLLRWSATYFRALANGEEPPSKIRIEYDVYDTPSGLTPGYLKLLVKQLGTNGTVPVMLLYHKWTGVCLNGDCLMAMLKIGRFETDVQWDHFLAIAAGHLTESLSETMNLLCHLLTEEPVGGPPKISCELFTDLYAYLARLDCGRSDDDETENPEEKDSSDETTERSKEAVEKSEQSPGHTAANTVQQRKSHEGNPHVPGIGPAIPEVQIQATISYMQFWAGKQRGYIMPRNMDNYLCPSMNCVLPSFETDTPQTEGAIAQLAN